MTYFLTDNDCVRLGVSWTGDGTYGSGTCGGTCLLGLLAFGFCGGGCGDMLFACLIQSSSSYIKTWLLGIYIMWIYVYLFVITITHQWNLANAEVCEATSIFTFMRLALLFFLLLMRHMSFNVFHIWLLIQQKKFELTFYYIIKL